MNSTFSFDAPIHLVKLGGFGERPTSLGFFGTWIDALDEKRRLGLDSFSTLIDNDIIGRFAQEGIFDESEIRDRINATYRKGF